MGFLRSVLLWGSKNDWLCNKMPQYGFIKKAVKRFMPGEDVADAIDAAREFKQKNIITIFTQLGENISILSEAADVAEHYCTVLDKIADAKICTLQIWNRCEA